RRGRARARRRRNSRRRPPRKRRRGLPRENRRGGAGGHRALPPPRLREREDARRPGRDERRAARGAAHRRGSADPHRGDLDRRRSRRIANYYRFKGFYEVHVEPRETRSPNGQRAVLAFDIDEGPQIHVDEIVFAGNAAVDSSELRKILSDFVRSQEPIPVGDVHPDDDPVKLQGRTATSAADPPSPSPDTVFVESAYRDAANAMTGIYRQRGYLTAKVKLGSADIDLRARRGVVRFEVQEGPRAVVRELKFSEIPSGVDVREAGKLKT